MSSSEFEYAGKR
jgi:hypothetical protein